MTRAFSLNDGGPFHDLMRRLHLITNKGMIRSWWFVFVAWCPLVFAAALTMRLDPTQLDISVHTRLLIGIPMILFAERLIEKAAASAISSLHQGRFCEPSAIDRIVERGEHWRDARWPEAALLGLALLGGQLALWQVTGATGMFHAEQTAAGWSFPRVWYALVALPLWQFVMFRFLWRWLIWSYMLARISRLPLTGVATHADRAAGLSCLSRPLSGFSGFAFAAGAVLAGAWGTKLLTHQVTIPMLLPGVLGLVIGVIAIAAGPLLAFSSHLYRMRRSALAQYGDFVNEYTRAFHRKWIERATDQSPLGSPDIQSLNDLGSAFNVITSTRLFAFGIRPILGIGAGAILPMLPLFASTLSVDVVLRRIVGTILGGIPI